MRDYGYPTGDQDPLFHWRGYPVRLPMLLVVLHAAAMLLALFVQTLPLELAFVPRAVLSRFWTPFTYAFAHSPTGALWLAIELYMLWSFGREVNQHLGQRAFLQLYVGLLLIAPLAVWLFSLMQPVGVLIGSRTLHLGVFIAFATLFPGVGFFFGLTARWVAIILVAALAIQNLAAANTSGMVALAASAWFAFGFVQWQRGRFELPSFGWQKVKGLFRRKPKFRVVKPAPTYQPKRPGTSAPRMEATTSAQDQVDALLDKIARTGMASLTAAEKQKLEQLSAQLNERDRRGV